MDIEINYWAVLACGVASMILGFVWYGPLFGKKWMQVIGAREMDAVKRKEMQKKAMPLYAISLVLALFQAYVLAHYIAGWTEASGVENSLWIWAAFLVPAIAGASMWNNESGKIAWTRFLLQAGYYLVLFIIFGIILGSWK
jgi:hypothetical protein